MIAAAEKSEPEAKAGAASPVCERCRMWNLKRPKVQKRLVKGVVLMYSYLATYPMNIFFLNSI
jgi:hypothetical protein